MWVTLSGYFSFTNSLILELNHQRLTRLSSFHISKTYLKFFFHGNFAFPYWHVFSEYFRKQILSSSFSQFLTCFRSIWKLLAVWLMFFSFSKYQLVTLSLNSLQSDLLLVGTKLAPMQINV